MDNLTDSVRENTLKTKAQIRKAKICKPFGKRLSTGENNRRFKGTIGSNTIQQNWTHQSSGIMRG